MLLFEVTAFFKEGELQAHKELNMIIENAKGDMDTVEESVGRQMNLNSLDIYEASKGVCLPLQYKLDLENNSLILYVILDLPNKVIQTSEIKMNVLYAIDALIYMGLNTHPDSFLRKPVGSSKRRNILNEVNMNSEVRTKFREIIGDTSSRTDDYKSVICDKVDTDSILHIDLLLDLKFELDRIRKNKFKTFHGYPVNYIIPYEGINSIIPALIQEMTPVNRIISNTIVRIDKLSELRQDTIEKLYKIFTGCSIIFEVDSINKSDSESTSRFDLTIAPAIVDKILELSAEYSSSVLTFIAIKDLGSKDIILDMSRDRHVVFMPIFPKNVEKEAGLEYLNKLAKRDGFKAYKGELKESIYTPYDLDREYYKWKSKHLITSMGYTNLLTDKVKKELSYDPMEKLNNMIGLTNVKETVNQIISYFKMQKVYKEKGIATSVPCRHMVFYGDPGTAKTTIARLLGTILKQEGILTNGKFIETGRNGLVALYVGHTAIKTKDKIKKAKGGILFIDEAYSLVDDKAGLFGDEAINTLVQEMDNVREDTIIIFAGYPDKMEKFMDTNPGIRSRIGFHVKFDKYSKEELLQILLKLAKKEKFTLSEDALEEAKKQISIAIGTKDFGNGRFIRTLLEQAMMKQATRLSKDNAYVDMGTSEILTIQSEDITSMNKSSDKKKMGFEI